MVTITTLKELLTKFEVNIGECITEDTKLFVDLGIDSITLMSIICEFEEQYKMTFSEELLDFNEDINVMEFVERLNNAM
ncbi:MAG: acyl carrier protein [Lachnospiraceae bacterium]|nr:acyl carrier protein [Lachnospiraceae bacterium]